MAERSITCTPQAPELELFRVGGFILGANLLPAGYEGNDLQILQGRLLALILRAVEGRLTWNRDVKRVKLFPDSLVFELRLSFESLDQVFGVRLVFVEEPSLRRITFIGQHTKQSGADPEAARAAQNLAFQSAYNRYVETKSDNF